ncbi:cupin domain-containing protein [Paenibacillus sp. RRE4]|uniref:cupin domain-containing protein n=1 Tax=Paenibacillus sp. RRE4 TaxID=2962587 RepID=UPI0028826CD0|nr:cupin domain-containing protein [Paenibacillus sp. RRE4]MDT0123420.1 cupin domain-containing protein [Paenibacillus sp. RRE4]
MATSYMDFTLPNTQFSYDLSNNPLFKKDEHNYINALSVKQLNTLGNTSLLDIFLSAGNVVEPHIHQNATELVYCISGAAVVSLINPFTNELLHFPITPGQTANVPQGWWHYEVATTDHTHLLAIFDAPVPEAIFGSDILRLTPAKVLAHTYCLDEHKVQEVLAPIQKTVIIGPPKGCKTQIAPVSNHMPNVGPNLQPNIEPLQFQPNFQPNVQPNLQPNVQPNIEPNVQPNMQPNMPPYVNRLPHWGTWVDPRIIHEPGCPYYSELPVQLNSDDKV